MSDEKTSELSEASLPLDGNEIVGIVQSGVNVQTTTGAIAAIPFNGESIAIGLHSYAKPFPFNVAIGYYANAHHGYGVAIGMFSNLTGDRATAVGYNTQCSTNGIAVGNRSEADVTTVAVGAFSRARNFYSVALGMASYATYASTSIGYRAYCNGRYSVAIGAYSEASNYTLDAVAIGYRAAVGANRGVAIGKLAVAGYGGVSIGYKAGFQGATEGSVAIGGGTHNAESYSTAVGCYASTVGPGASALGGYAYAKQSGTALGASSYANHGAIALGNMAHAAGFYSVALGPGAITNNSNSIVFGFGAQDQMIGEFVVNGFPAFGSPLGALDRYQKLIAATNGSDATTAIMTSDGNAPSSTNMAALNNVAISTLTARVTGVNINFATGGDMATFVLDPPVLIVRHGDGTYTFVNEPNFVLENSTVGASGWTVPVLLTNVDNNVLLLVVTQTGEADIHWIAHLKCEGSG